MAGDTVQLIASAGHGATATVLVDQADAVRLAGRRISIGSHGYAQIYAGGTRTLLHRWVMGIAVGDRPDVLVDHINRKRLDCRRANLRLVSPAESSLNRELPQRDLPLGVYRTRSKRFAAKLKRGYRNQHLGTYDTPEQAADARVDVEQLLGRVRELAGSLDEMTRCRDAAVRALHRDDIETDIDVEDAIANALWGPGWDWEDERTPRLIARDVAPEIRPTLAKACEQRDQALARVAELEAKRTALEAACDGWAEAGRNEERIWAARVAELEQQLAVAQAATETNREVARVLLSELSANKPPAECGAPHPVADDTRCERQPGHDGWHAATIGAWPSTVLPPLGTSTARSAR
ncbi:HNH endonuclease [Kitasatospora cheerisanensis]|nr:HNH endonuclease [Kitasatospora cheerisanensis]